MPRPVFSFLYEVADLLKKSYVHFRRQKILSAYGIVVMMVLIALLFTFVSFIQTISPFVYPLF